MTEALARLGAALADRYRIERELGRGGMATVYLAHDLRHERDVALKVLRPELAAMLGAGAVPRRDPDHRRLDHPHILTLIDSGESGGVLWYVMPFIRGESLRQRLDRERQLSRRRTLCDYPTTWPPPSITPIGRASSTATSSRRTSCSTRARRWWPTSASRWRCARPRGSD